MSDPKTPASKSDPGQLQALLKELADEKKQVSVRLQLNGNSWTEHYATVLVFSSHAIVLTHMPTRTVINISDLNQVTGFEIDQPYMFFRPFHRYVINPTHQHSG